MHDNATKNVSLSLKPETLTADFALTHAMLRLPLQSTPEKVVEMFG